MGQWFLCQVFRVTVRYNDARNTNTLDGLIVSHKGVASRVTLSSISPPALNVAFLEKGHPQIPLPPLALLQSPKSRAAPSRGPELGHYVSKYLVALLACHQGIHCVLDSAYLLQCLDQATT
jgi:hypothetical protein